MDNARMEMVKNAVIYQINLRVFTPEGTLAAAEKFLPEVADTGADIVYLCPVAESDPDPDPAHWSTRQKRSAAAIPAILTASAIFSGSTPNTARKPISALS